TSEPLLDKAFRPPTNSNTTHFLNSNTSNCEHSDGRRELERCQTAGDSRGKENVTEMRKSYNYNTPRY
ncbi:hypothetical protein SLA2020_347300, partial [Shorea laevis]